MEEEQGFDVSKKTAILREPTGEYLPVQRNFRAANE